MKGLTILALIGLCFAGVTQAQQPTTSLEMRLAETASAPGLVEAALPNSDLLAIIVNGEVVAAPTVRGTISNQAVTTGDFTRAEAERVASDLRR